MLTDLQSVSDTLDVVRQATLERLVERSQPQLDWSPSQSIGSAEWSPGEVFMHIALDEIYLRELIARPLIEGVQPPEDVRFIGVLASAKTP
jgi:hypothetical protein